LDLVGLELWFAPIPEEEARALIALLHAATDQATLNRVLWLLPQLSISLSESDRNRLVELADSGNAMTRSGVIRLSVISHDESLGRRIVDLGVSAAAGINPWEERWVTHLLARFGGHLPFEDLAKRLRPAAAGFVIGQRGNRKNELDIYAGCLEQQWRQVVSAEDPAVECLPEIIIENCEEGAPPPPRLSDPAGPPTIRYRSESWTSGPPRDDAGPELKKFFSTTSEERVRELNEDRRRKIDGILAAWRTEAFQWYGQTFSLAAMDLLYQTCAARVDRWIQPALADSAAGLAVRVRLGGLLEPICRVLLNRNPQLGFRLWQMLRKREASPIVFDTTDIAFSADTSESKLARKAILEESWNDAAIAEVASACGRWKRQGWLDETVEELISAERLWKRAKGLTLASLSDTTPEDFEKLVSKAAIEHTWVEGSLRALRADVRKNHLARHWYGVFVNSRDPDTAWGALQLVLAHADERLLNWCAEIEKDAGSNELTEKRLRFLGLGWHTRRDLRKEIDRDSDRRERLFGLKIQVGEIAPFMPS